MNQNDIIELDHDELDLESIEQSLEQQLLEQDKELERLREEFQQIGTAENLGHVFQGVVWDQFINQIGVVAGEDFIKENKGLPLDLRESAHIQTTENFAKGKIATHNTYIDYQERYDNYQGNFQHDDHNRVVTHKTRSGREEATLVAGARKPFDNDRPIGSRQSGTDMDHTVSAGEIMRNPAVNAHLSKEEQIDFANSEQNLNEMPASHNRSKKDTSMGEWLDNPNAKGQKPKDIYSDPMSDDYLSDELEQKYREKDKEAREELDKRVAEGEKRSIETGKQSRKEEAKRIGKTALRSVVMTLLASLVKELIQKLIVWVRRKEKNLNTFIDSVKEALNSFAVKLKGLLTDALGVASSSVVVASLAKTIVGPVVSALKKAWVFLKQGAKSVKEAITFWKDPKNRHLPLSVKMMELGKIITVGLTAGGAIALSGVFETALLGIPGLGVEIPLLGSLASLLGVFLGGLVSGIIGALILNFIDRLVEKKLKAMNKAEQSTTISKRLAVSEQLVVASCAATQQKMLTVAQEIGQRNRYVGQLMSEQSKQISDCLVSIEEQTREKKQKLQDVYELLKSI